MENVKKLCHLKEVFKEIYRFEQGLKKRTGLSLNQALTLCSLRSGNMASGELARELGLSPGRMSKILSSLEDEALVERSLDKVDRRIMHFSITQKGLSIIDNIDIESLEIPEIRCKR